MTRAVSAFGDAAFLLPLLVAFCLYLCAARRFGLARDVAGAAAIGLGATVASKLVFRACGHEFEGSGLTSPSGHAAFAAIAYGSLAYAFGIGRPRGWRIGLAVAAGLVALAVGASRLRPGVHTPAEVAAGLAIGAASVGLLLRLRAGRDTRPLSPLPPLAGAAILAGLLLGHSLTFERQIARTARLLAAGLDVCPAVADPERLAPRPPG